VIAALWPALASAGEVTGAVHGFPDGDAIEGVTVRVYDAVGRSTVGWSAADGTWSVDSLAEGWHRAGAFPSDDHLPALFGDTYSYCGSERFRVDADGVVSGVDFQLPGGGSLQGTVSNHDGQPVVGAAVRVQGLDFYNAALAREAITDGEGAWRVDGLDSISIDGVPQDGAYRLSVSRGGASLHWPGAWLASDAEPVGAARGELRTVDLAFPEPGAIEGIVLDDGVPRAGVDVRLTVASSPGVQSAVTDADGAYRFDGLDGASVRVQARDDGFALTGLPSAADTGESVALEAGQTVAAPDLALLEGGDLRVAALVPEGASRITVRSTAGALLAGQSIEGPGSTLFSDLPPGDVVVTLAGLVVDGIAPSQPVEARLVGGKTVEVEVVGQAGAAVFGTVQARGGRWLGDATVDAVEPGTGDVLASVRTTVLGFELGPVPLQPFALRVSYTPFCSADPSFVPVFAPDALTLTDAAVFEPTPGERFDVELILPPDGDADGMDDIWELAWHLDPLRDDGDEDPDGDSISNLEEYRADTDPLGWTALADCAGGGGFVLLALLFRRKRGQ
jgi:hypothetical protein